MKPKQVSANGLSSGGMVGVGWEGFKMGLLGLHKP